uniref:Uncharacterized protein n=1 Tax=Sphaeramia orbicularis TaxID=375764 RepID=A0A673A8W0_9TELE
YLFTPPPPTTTLPLFHSFSLRILLLVPAGLPVRSQGDSQSDNKVMDNITVRQGETVFLR